MSCSYQGRPVGHLKENKGHVRSLHAFPQAVPRLLLVSLPVTMSLPLRQQLPSLRKKEFGIWSLKQAISGATGPLGGYGGGQL